MNLAFIIKMIIQTVGGLGLFLLGMKFMSEGMQAIAGEKIKKLISKVTDNRFIACGVGASITAMIQSSSVTTVMVVGMVNASVMNLKQAIGVILGADIGTTVTAWLIAFNIVEYGLAIIGISTFFYLFASKDRMRYAAMMFVGLGLVFFGLTLMKEGFKPLRDMPEFLNLLSMFEPDNYWGLLKCIFVGAFTTAIIQSSSATVAITISLALSSIISYETAVALVLGENIGTTITAFLASLGTTTNAKRAAYTHILIKIFGVLIMIPFFFQYIELLNFIFPDSVNVAAKIAFAHTGFNIFIVTLFIPFIKTFTIIVQFILPDKSHEEKPHLTFMDVRFLETPVLGLKQSYDEIIRMANGLNEMMNLLKDSIILTNRNEDVEKKIFHREQVYDEIQKEIVEFISKIMTGNLPHSTTIESRNQLRMADEYESISDYIVDILKLTIKMKNEKLVFSDPGKKEILELHDSVSDYFLMITEATKTKNTDILNKALSMADFIRHKIKDIKSNHLTRLAAEETTFLMSLIYMDIVSAYRKLKDHILNVAEVLAGEK